MTIIWNSTIPPSGCGFGAGPGGGGAGLLLSFEFDQSGFGGCCCCCCCWLGEGGCGAAWFSIVCSLNSWALLKLILSELPENGTSSDGTSCWNCRTYLSLRQNCWCDSCRRLTNTSTPANLAFQKQKDKDFTINRIKIE